MTSLRYIEELSATMDTNDPVETFHMAPNDYEEKRCSALFALEFYMGSKEAGTTDLETFFSNALRVRGSIEKLLDDGKLTVLPTQGTANVSLEVLEKNRKLRKSHNLERRMHFTKYSPESEHEYSVFSVGTDVQLYLSTPEGYRQTFSPPYSDLPSFRSTVHPLFAIDYPSGLLLKPFKRPNEHLPIYVYDYLTLLSKAPERFRNLLRRHRLKRELGCKDKVLQVWAVYREISSR
ncbi:hypothetical protein L218DRAFT_999826 [Marasmius fiardii PR-910]|nr:hypothetical protein L218DRAFT_999826 [Marasmius fiardii PR-910]